jgi:hypothetical protein
VKKKTIVCLSSGLTPQYRLDILRSLALPSGMSIQFRYSKSLVAENLRDDLSGNRLAGAVVLLAYVDCTEAYKKEGVACPVTPCRYAILTTSSRIGSKFFLTFQLGAFAPAAQSTDHGQVVEDASPRWVVAEAGLEIKGLWCFSTTAKSSPVEGSSNAESWETLIRQLATHGDFAEEPLFFVIEGVYERAGDGHTRQETVKGEYRFKSDKDYSLCVFHLHPRRNNVAMPKSVGLMRVKFGEPQLTGITASALPVDSPYDLKYFRFRTGSVTREQFSSIVIGVEGRETGKQLESQPEIYLPVRCLPLVWKSVTIMVVLAVLLWAQQFVPLASKGGVSLPTSAAMFVLAILISAFLVFGLKKPL